jgi:hypothetical protein
VLGFVLASLLNNALVARRRLFFTDRQRSLQNAIADFFGWHGAASLLLDWYHVVKKFREELSLACTGREIRNRHGQALLRLLSQRHAVLRRHLRLPYSRAIRSSAALTW